MPAVRGRVDQHNSVASPPEIPAPEVSVQSGRTILVVEIASATTHNEALEVSASWWVKPRVRAFGHRRQPLVSVEAPQPACSVSDIGKGLLMGPKYPDPLHPSGAAPKAAAPASWVRANLPPNS